MLKYIEKIAHKQPEIKRRTDRLATINVRDYSSLRFSSDEIDCFRTKMRETIEAKGAEQQRRRASGTSGGAGGAFSVPGGGWRMMRMTRRSRRASGSSAYRTPPLANSSSDIVRGCSSGARGESRGVGGSEPSRMACSFASRIAVISCRSARDSFWSAPALRGRPPLELDDAEEPRDEAVVAELAVPPRRELPPTDAGASPTTLLPLS